MEFFQFLVDKKIVRPDQVELMVPSLVSRISGAATSTPVPPSQRSVATPRLE